MKTNMHIIECYALSCGLKIDKPTMEIEEIELPTEKYITFHPDCGKGNTRNYEHWGAVLDEIKDLGYKILRIGDDEKSLERDITTSQADCLDETYFNALNLKQLAFLIKNCSLHLGYDSLPIHIASMFSKKIVGLYSLYSSHSYPYWSKKEDIRLHEPDWKLYKPSFNYMEQTPIINTIDHKEVSCSVKELLSV